MNTIQFPHGRWATAHDLIEEARATGTPIRDLLGAGLPADYTQDQLIEAYRGGECTIGYLAARLGLDLVVVRRLLQTGNPEA
jgi:hypothetical protein